MVNLAYLCAFPHPTLNDGYSDGHARALYFSDFDHAATRRALWLAHRKDEDKDENADGPPGIDGDMDGEPSLSQVVTRESSWIASSCTVPTSLAGELVEPNAMVH